MLLANSGTLGSRNVMHREQLLEDHGAPRRDNYRGNSWRTLVRRCDDVPQLRSMQVRKRRSYITPFGIVSPFLHSLLRYAGEIQTGDELSNISNVTSSILGQLSPKKLQTASPPDEVSICGCRVDLRLHCTPTITHPSEKAPTRLHMTFRNNRVPPASESAPRMSLLLSRSWALCYFRASFRHRLTFCKRKQS